MICTDLTPESDALVTAAGRLASLGMRHAVLTHVVDVFGARPGGAMSAGGAEETFVAQIAALENLGVSVRVEAPLGHPAFSLEEVRKRHGASVIVVGSHGHGMFDRTVCGSVSSDLMQMGETPVLVASSTSSPASGTGFGGLLSDVLLCTDFSEAAARALSALLALASLSIERLTIVHVQDLQRIESQGCGTVDECDRRDAVRLARLKERLLAAGIAQVDTEIVHGSPADEIERRAESGEYTLVVLGSRGRAERSEEGLLGGVSDRVLKEAKSPLLLIPAPISPGGPVL